MQAGQPITFNGTSANRKIVDLESIASSNPLTITASKLTVSGDVDIQGVLNTVTGTETVFEDTILVLNQSDTSGTVADTSAALVSGIEINRSFAGEVSLKWDDSVDLWKLRGGSGLEVVGDGGNVGITTNDSQGNANITFNHARGEADKDGNSGRIEVNVDRSSGEVAYMDFEVGDNVTQGNTTLYPTLRLRDNGATINRPTLEIENNLLIDSGVASDRTTSQSLTDTYPDMKGQIRFDNTYSDTNLGPNKIVMHDNGSSWVGGFGLSSSTLDSYSGTNFRWSRMEGPSATPVQKMHLDGDGNLDVTGKISIGTGPTDALDVATKSYVDSQIGGVDLSTCAIKSESNNFTAEQTVTVNSANPALQLTQSGTGDVIQCLDVTGDTTFFSVDQNGVVRTGNCIWVQPGQGTVATYIQLGHGRTDNGYSYIDLVGDTTHTDYSARFVRGNGGENAYTNIEHKGTGNLNISANDGGPINLIQSGTWKLRVNATGDVEVANNLKATNMLVEQNLQADNQIICSVADNKPGTNSKVRFGRDAVSQYMTFHGHSSGNFMSSISSSGNPKTVMNFGISTDGGATLASSYTLRGNSGNILHTGNLPVTVAKDGSDTVYTFGALP